MKLSIISPTFNEAENVPRLMGEISRSMDGIDYEILIVDDNSPDLTWSVAENISRQNPRVRVLRRMRNPGLGPAVIDGFNAASGDVVACIDADLQHDPTILPKMVEELASGADVVVGSRYVDGGGTGKWSLLRRTESWIATKMAQIFLGVRLKDPMSGYFLMRREDFSAVEGKLDARGFKILLEILAQLQPDVLREVPYTFRTRKAGESKLCGKVVFQYLEQLWRLSWMGRVCSDGFLKFTVVGGSGVVVNLVAMAFLLKLTDFRDWRASALASLVANLNNYILNNIWTFADRMHRGFRVVRGYLSYLMMSGVGLGATTAAYAGLTRGLARLHLLQDVTGLQAYLIPLFCQFIAILLGMYFNYELNKNITWRSTTKAGTARPWNSNDPPEPRKVTGC